MELRANRTNIANMRVILRASTFCLIATLFAVVSGTGAIAQRAVPEAREQVMLSFAPLVKQAAPAVVNIFTRKAVQQRGPSSPLFNDPFFRRFFGDAFEPAQPRERAENSLGSGVIVRPDGLIVTNFHVIEGADTIRVVLADRREFDAVILREDQQTDLAILRVDTGGETLPHIELGDSDKLEVGDLVLAIGNPFGVGTNQGGNFGFQFLHPDRCGYQSGKFRWGVVAYGWQPRRDQHRHFLT